MSLFPDLEYTFKHALTHEVAYQSLLQERRRALHAQIVEALERLYPDRLAQHVERLAHHSLRGEVWEKAVTYGRQAGAKAFAHSANREAVAYFEQALEALAHLPEARETLEQAIDLRFDLRTALVPLGKLQRVLRDLHDAEGLARTLGDQRRLGWVSVYMSHYLWLTGRPTEVRTFAENARAVTEALGDFPLRVAANHYLGAASFLAGDYRQAKDFFLRNVELLAGDRSWERCGLTGFPAVMSRWLLAESLANEGEFEEGVVHAQEGIRIAEALDHAFSLILACWGLAYLHYERGDLGRAVPLYERAFGLSRERNVPFLAAFTAWRLGHTYAVSGRLAEGLPLLEQALTALESMGLVGAFHSAVVAHLGESCVLAGRLEDALAFTGRALTLARERGERGYEAYALRLLGEIALHRDPPEVKKAEDHYRQALALADELGMRPLVAHCHLGLGTLYAKMGQREQARSELSAAIELYRSMEMTFWLTRAEAELAQAE